MPLPAALISAAIPTLPLYIWPLLWSTQASRLNIKQITMSAPCLS